MQYRDDLLQFYQQQVRDDFWPFWQKFIDTEQGGVFTCLSNDGTTVLSSDKYIWSQGRFLYLLGKMAQMIKAGQLDLNNDDLMVIEQSAHQTASFLIDKTILPDNSCCYITDATGQAKEQAAGSGLHTSFYVDCFVVLGLSQYLNVYPNSTMLDQTVAIYDSIIKRLDNNTVLSEPYPIYPDFQPFAFAMIMSNICNELYHCCVTNQHEAQNRVKAGVKRFFDSLNNDFFVENGGNIELKAKVEGLEDTLLYRHRTPGHSLECLWFMLDSAAILGVDFKSDYLKRVSYAFDLGWDHQYGGLKRYVDCDTKDKPTGRLLDDAYERLVLDTWDSKLWWIHSEGLHALMLCQILDNDQKYQQMYQQMHDYVFVTFPNPDKNIGEWIQIRDRQGQPMQKQVALPVKDPFHIMRNFLLTIQALQTIKQ